MILITDREYAEIVMRVGRLMAASRSNNRLFNSARIMLNTLNKAYRNRQRRTTQWMRQKGQQ